MKKTNNQKTSNKKDKTNESLINALKNDERVWVNTDKKELNNTQLLNLLEKTDEKIISLFLDNDDIKRAFFVKIRDSYVFKMQDFRFYMNSKSINNSYTKYANRIGLTEDKRFLKDNSDVVLDFPFKDCVLQGGQSSDEGLEISYELKDDQFKQTKTKRKEIFFNQTLAYDEIDRLLDKKVLVNFKKFYKDDENKVIETKVDSFKDKDNLLIKGNNLIALHCLKEHLKGDKAKLIYIDPPYNTGNDSFNYNDKFNHSTWLVFMKNRLEIARELLRDDGVIFVQCDDNEQAYLKVLMDEIFGRENFVATICRVATKRVKGDAKNINKIHDYIHIYAKQIQNFTIQHIQKKYDENSIYELSDEFVKERGKHLLRPLDNGNLGYTNKLDYIIEAPNGEKICAGGDFNARQQRLNGNFNKKDWSFRWSEEKFKWGLQNGFIVFKETNGKQRVYFKIYQFVNNELNQIERTDKILSVFDEMFNNKGTTEIKNLYENNIFAYPKPEALLQRIIEISTKENDLVIDFFAGSGTTLAVAHKMKRRYIGIEQMDYIESITKERLKKVIDGEQGGISKACEWNGGGGSFIYLELATWNEKAKDKILSCKNDKDLIKLFDEICEKYFLNYYVNIKEFRKIIEEKGFLKLKLEEKQHMMIEMLDLNQMYISYSEIDDKKYKIDEQTKKLNDEFYGENNG